MVIKKLKILLFLTVLLPGLLCAAAVAGDSKAKPYQIIDTETLKAEWKAKPKDLLVIDTRNPEEFEDIHIPGAVNLPFKKFDDYKHLLPSKKSVRLVFYCSGIK